MCRAYADPKGTAVDCTCGRGKDTLWLARHCGRVYSFDIQEEALKSTEELLDANEIDCRERSGSQKVILIKDSHENIKKYGCMICAAVNAFYQKMSSLTFVGGTSRIEGS